MLPHVLKALIKSRKGKKLSRSLRKKLSLIRNGKVNIKIYKVTNPSGEMFYTNNGLSVFCEKHNISISSMSQLARGIVKCNRDGWKCEYVN